MPNTTLVENTEKETQKDVSEIPEISPPEMEMEEEKEVDEEEEVNTQKTAAANAEKEEAPESSEQTDSGGFNMTERGSALSMRSAPVLKNPKYPELVPQEPIEYRKNLEGLLSQTGKQSIGKSMRPVVDAVGELNAVLDANFSSNTEDAFQGALGIYEKAKQAADTYAEGRSPWTKAGKKRLQIVKGLSQFLNWERRVVPVFWKPYFQNISAGTASEYKISDMYDVSNLQKLERVYYANVYKKAEEQKKALDQSPVGNSYEEQAGRNRDRSNMYINIGHQLLEGNSLDRQIGTIMNGMSLLQGDTMKQSMERSMNLISSDVKGYEPARIKRIREIENVFEEVLKYDPNEQKFDSLEDLEDPKFAKADTISTMIFDLQAYIKEYKGWVEKKQPGLALTEDMFKEVQARHDILVSFSPWYSFVSFLKNPALKGLLDEDVIKNPTLEKVSAKAYESSVRKDLDKKTSKLLGDAYAHYCRLVAEDDFGPGKDPMVRLENSRKKFGVPDGMAEQALEAIRRSREEKAN